MENPIDIIRQIHELEHKIHVSGCESCKKIYRKQIADLKKKRDEFNHNADIFFAGRDLNG